MERKGPRFSRRELMATGAVLPFVVARPGAALAEAVSPRAQPEKRAPPKAPAADSTLRISEESIAPLGKPTGGTLVNGALPGPEIRYREGDMFRVLVENALQVPTTIHWHGLLVPNYMDGVPEITQLPIEPRESVLYEYPLRQNGTYWYHSHYRFQEQTGLSGPFIIDARNEPYAYDREAVVFLADWINQSPGGIIPQIGGEQKMTWAANPVPPGGYPFPGNDPFAVDL
ncbi:MAG: multicopper oxidase domain-containing protein, partial [Verrucomicrobiota bacterium]|nr:multicopper oxidase domain-containing protein [Verrucomicrobiota bacterium]